MLLRVILDDLHGDNADAVNAPAAGADYPVLPVRPASFPDWVVAHAKRASPHAFDLLPADTGTKRKQATAEDPTRTKKPKKDLEAKAARKKTRRVRHDSSSSESSESDAGGSDSDSDSDVEETDAGRRNGNDRNCSTSAALLAYMKSTHVTRLGVVDCIVAITASRS